MSRTGPTSPFSVLRSPKTPARLHILGHRLIKGSTIPLFNETFETGHEHEGLSRVLLPVSGLWVSCGLGVCGLESWVLSFGAWILRWSLVHSPSTRVRQNSSVERVRRSAAFYRSRKCTVRKYSYSRNPNTMTVQLMYINHIFLRASKWNECEI